MKSEVKKLDKIPYFGWTDSKGNHRLLTCESENCTSRNHNDENLRYKNAVFTAKRYNGNLDGPILDPYSSNPRSCYALCAECFSAANPHLFGGNIYKAVYDEDQKRVYLVRKFKTKRTLLRYWRIGKCNYLDESIKEWGESKESYSSSIHNSKLKTPKSPLVIFFNDDRELRNGCSIIHRDRFENLFYPEFFGLKTESVNESDPKVSDEILKRLGSKIKTDDLGGIRILDSNLEIYPSRRFFKVETSYSGTKNFRSIEDLCEFLKVKYQDDSEGETVSIGVEFFEDMSGGENGGSQKEKEG